VKAVLKITSPQSNKEYVLGLHAHVNLGRSSKNTVQIQDEKVSSTHCRFILRRDRLEIYDLDSKNGTYLNGIRIENSEVFIGDLIKIGDTIVCLEESKMEKESLDVLTFPGPFKERLNYELKADFTGARIQNQLLAEKPAPEKISLEASHAKEIDIRLKAQSQIILSKQEIRSRRKDLAVVATSIDLSFIFIVICIPLYIVGNFLQEDIDDDKKLIVLLILELTYLLIFYFCNFRLSKFTIGERLGGIQKLYSEQ
jgi:hypothetical protein